MTWTEAAWRDLEHTADYIAADSPGGRDYREGAVRQVCGLVHDFSACVIRRHQQFLGLAATC